VASRAALEARVVEVIRRFEGNDVPRPPHWGGYVVRPRRVEFMERKPGRIHDRIQYTLLEDGGWEIVRLFP
jgi:pyridoxamine 5'-phosphate oxidase